MVRLSETNTGAPKGLDKDETKQKTESLRKKLSDLQELLYAESKHAVLIILQGMDASGKDGAINKVFSSINPQGLRVQSFKQPTEEEKKHDFLWRVHIHTPETGMIRIFNRSHYEDVLITRVHGWCSDEQAQLRFRAINRFEEMLVNHNNTRIFKFYLHVSREEQQRRFRERIDNPAKHWKYDANDYKEAELWDKYMQMYEDVFEYCNIIPWTIIPSDQNWYKEYLIAKTVVEGLESVNMKWPELPGKR